MAVMPLDCVLVVHLVVGNDVSNHRMFEQLSGYVPANHRATERKAQGEKVLSDGHVGLSGNIRGRLDLDLALRTACIVTGLTGLARLLVPFSQLPLTNHPFGPPLHGSDHIGLRPVLPDEPPRVRFDRGGEIRVRQRLPGRYPLARIEGHEPPEQVGGERPDGILRKDVEKRPGRPMRVRVPAPTLPALDVVPVGAARGTEQPEDGQELVQRPRTVRVRKLVEERVAQVELREDATGAPYVNLGSVYIPVVVAVVVGRRVVVGPSGEIVLLRLLMVQQSLRRHVVRHRARSKRRHGRGWVAEPATARPARDGDPALAFRVQQ
mmetsp:Transcript_1744/g.7787  ORF Transcript_1744/g.7787 Transcript_1744/m.7787 type:complete len:322 (-) Transcript_1744:1159-2124(-)